PTEATVEVSAWAFRGVEREVVPIGRPIWNTQLLVLNEDLQLVPPGVEGELYIGGNSLVRGYHRRGGLTADRFIPNPFASRPGERLYRTGDLVRWNSQGALEYVGRIDHQVKIHGLRIELGEIEARLLEHTDVRESAVIVSERDSVKRLVGYVVLKGEAAPNA